MDFETMNQTQSSMEYTQQEPLGLYTAKTFGWMFAGLLLTFVLSIGLYTTGAVLLVFSNMAVFYGIGIAELVVVLVLSARIQKLSVGACRALFFLYAALNGVVFSAYFLMFQVPVLIWAFGGTALFFGVMAVIGYATKADLSSLRNFLVGGVIFLAAFWVLSMFLNLGKYELIVCYIGIFIFLVFTAYDTQKIRAYHQAYAGDAELAKKASIFAALQLYLDFVNLFLYLVRILAKRK